MARPSPLGIEGTALSYRDPDEAGRMQVAQVRARDEQGAWQAKRFKVRSWHRDGSPILPDEAKEWARTTRKTFVKEQAVATAATFQEFAELLATNLESAGVSAQRAQFIRAVAKGLAEKGITDMRRDTFPARVQAWIKSLEIGWRHLPGAWNRPKSRAPLTPNTRNKVLNICRQVTALAIRRRRLPYDPLIELPRFRQETKLKSLFTVAELRQMVSDEARDRTATRRQELEIAIAEHGGSRTEAIRAIAMERRCHWTSIYNALKREPIPDPWWLACCLLVYTGCRAQEAMALRWEWIRWDARIITLKLADDYASKTDSERLIPLEPELADILRPMAKPAGHILAPEIRAGGSGLMKQKSSANGEGSRDYTDSLRRYLHRCGMEAKDRTAHSLRHCYITLKLARADMNTERLRKAVGHARFETTMGYGVLSQLYEIEVDKWPDTTIWLRREVPA